MSLQIKAFLYEDRPNKPKEIRRFAIDQEVSSNYDYLRTKVSSVFPNLGENNFALQWRDSENDFIWFNSDEELIQALGQLDTQVFKLYIKENPSKSSSDQESGSGPQERGPGCGRRRFPGCGRGFGQWMGPQGYGQFSPNFGGQWPFFAQPQGGQETPKEGKPQTSSDSASASQQQQQQQQQQGQFSGENYLQHVGNAVADFLTPFGIDVDINVEHKGAQKKCPGNKKQPTDKSAEGSGDKGEPQSSDQSRDSPDETDWTFLKKDSEKSGAGEKKEEDKMETDEDAALKSALSQLQDMGFNDNGGWLTNLLKACNFDIGRVMEAMQPAHTPKQ